MKFNFAINFKNWFKSYWPWLVVIILAVSFFIAASSFNFITQKNDFIKWLSPDESANYNFAKLYAQENELEIFEKYNLLAADILHPRSLRSDFGYLKPVSFLGIILIYGRIAALTSYKILPYLTPCFAALGIIFYYLLIRKIFGRRNALFSTLILAVFPPYLYYSARSMFHNVLFVVLLVLSLYFAYLSVNGRKRFLTDLWAGFGGIFLGLTIITRSSELIWLLPVWLILWLYNLKKFGLVKPIIFIAFMLLAITPAMYWNKILYQSYWRGGYNEMNQSIINIAKAGTNIIKSGAVDTAVIKTNFSEIKNNVFHFGYQPVKSLKMLYYYFARMFYWLFWPAFFGLLLILAKIKKWKTKHYAYLTALAFTALILVAYYGSWDFHDNPDPKSHTIGNSYTRYWLPIYLGVIPLAVVFFLKLSNLFRKKILIIASRILIIGIIYFISIKFILVGSAEGLIRSAKNQLAAPKEYGQVLSLTESRAVIITKYHDKLFFPARKVIVGVFDDDNMIKEYAFLTKYLPVYYYNFTFPEKDINYLNSKRLPPFKLQINPVEKITEDFTLYKLEAATSTPEIKK
jgi:hypothetical protein